MGRLARQVIADIRRGESLDLYVTIVLAISTVVLALQGNANQTLISAMTATLLGLLAISLLQQRAHIDSLTRDTSKEDLVEFTENRPYDLADELDDSVTAVLGGIDLARTYANHEPAILKWLEAGNELRILLYQPIDGPLSHTVLRSSKPWSEARQKGLIEGTLDDFDAALTQVPKARLEIRLSPFPFYFGFAGFDLGKPNARLFVKHYAFRTVLYDGPWMTLPRDQFWMGHFTTEIEALWSQAHTPGQ